MKLTVARDSSGRRVIHTPSGRQGKLTGFSCLARVFVRYDDGVDDKWGTLPEELEFADDPTRGGVSE